MTQISDYAPAIEALALFAILTQIVGVMAGMWKTQRRLVPGSTPAPHYGDPLYRTARASANAVETTGIFATVIVAAILAGFDPVWVNRLAYLSVLSRLGMVVVHVAGSGRPDRSWRTLFFMGGWIAHAALAVMVLLVISPRM